MTPTVADSEAILVGHGEVDYEQLPTHDQVYTGCRHGFAPLTDNGVLQVRQLAIALADLRPATIISSPYTRTMQTAAVLVAHLGGRLDVDLRLHDWLPVRNGQQALSHDIVTAKIAEYDTWKATGRLPPDRTWETDDEMAARLAAVHHDQGGHGQLVIVTHAAVIGVTIGIHHVPLASWHRWAPICS